jgi:hypothetical protein
MKIEARCDKSAALNRIVSCDTTNFGVASILTKDPEYIHNGVGAANQQQVDELLKSQTTWLGDVDAKYTGMGYMRSTCVDMRWVEDNFP